MGLEYPGLDEPGWRIGSPLHWDERALHLRSCICRNGVVELRMRNALQ